MDDRPAAYKASNFQDFQTLNVAKRGDMPLEGIADRLCDQQTEHSDDDCERQTVQSVMPFAVFGPEQGQI